MDSGVQTHAPVFCPDPAGIGRQYMYTSAELSSRQSLKPPGSVVRKIGTNRLHVMQVLWRLSDRRKASTPQQGRMCGQVQLCNKLHAQLLIGVLAWQVLMLWLAYACQEAG